MTGRLLWLTPRSKGTFCWVTSDQVLLGRRVGMICCSMLFLVFRMEKTLQSVSTLQQPPVKGQCVCSYAVQCRGWWREDEELMQGEGSCSTPRLHKCPCTTDFGQSISKSSLKSFRLKFLLQRSVRRQHIKPCVKAHSRQETITNSIVFKSPSHYGRLQSSICSQAEVRTQDFTREASVWHPCREML